MMSFCTGFGLVLMWGTFQSTLGAGQGECPTPQTIEFAEYFAEWYVLGTRARYECEGDYKRRAGTSNLITCENRTAQAQWTCRIPPSCIAASELTHRSSRQSSSEACEGSSSSSQITTQQILKDVCRIPKPLKHATVKVVKYPVGQKLQYRCLEGYRAWTLISEISTCEDSNGRGAWSSLSLRCTNDTSRVTEPAKKSLFSSDSPSKRFPTPEGIHGGSQTTSEQAMKAAMLTIAAMVSAIHM